MGNCRNFVRFLTKTNNYATIKIPDMPHNTDNNDLVFSRFMSRRTFVKAGIGAAAAVGIGASAVNTFSTVDVKGKILIIGGGAAGCSFAARLMRRIAGPDITLIDPSDRQYYQPGFTFIAAGIFSPDEVWKPQSACIPGGVKWVKDSVVALDPERRTARTAKGETYTYDYLVLTPGLKLCWDRVEGISRETLGEGNAHCIYDFEGAKRIWPAIDSLTSKGGKFVFTDTYTKHKCGGAPKKICMLTEHLSRRKGTRDECRIDYFCSEKALYDVPYYTPRLLQLYDERGIGLQVDTRVSGIDTSAKKVYLEKHGKVKAMEYDEALGRDVEKEQTTVKPFVEDYDLLSFVPPQSAPDFVRESGLSWTEGKLAADGWVMVDKETLVHRKFHNVICLGDCAGIPTSKTSSAIRMQLPVAVANLLDIMQGKEPSHKYNGYACCPIVTDYGHVLLCEFDYDKKPVITFPFSLLDMSREQYAAWLLKKHILKPMFFNGMLKGLM